MRPDQGRRRPFGRRPAARDDTAPFEPVTGEPTGSAADDPTESLRVWREWRRGDTEELPAVGGAGEYPPIGGAGPVEDLPRRRRRKVGPVAVIGLAVVAAALIAGGVAASGSSVFGRSDGDTGSGTGSAPSTRPNPSTSDDSTSTGSTPTGATGGGSDAGSATTPTDVPKAPGSAPTPPVGAPAPGDGKGTARSGTRQGRTEAGARKNGPDGCAARWPGTRACGVTRRRKNC